MTTYDALSLQDKILSDASDDWLTLGWILGCVESYEIFDSSLIRVVASGVIAGLIMDDYLVVGELAENAVIPWGLPREQVLGKLVHEVTRSALDETVEDVIWFDLTPKGESRVASWRKK